MTQVRAQQRPDGLAAQLQGRPADQGKGREVAPRTRVSKAPSHSSESVMGTQSFIMGARCREGAWPQARRHVDLGV